MSNEKHFPIGLKVLKSGTRIPFNVFRVSRTRAGKRLALCLSKNIPYLESHRERFLDDGVENLFVRESERPAYRAYLRANLQGLMKSPVVNNDEKAEILIDTARQSIVDVFKNPNQPRAIREAVEVVGNISKHLQTYPEEFLTFFKPNLNGYYLYSHSLKVCIYTVALASQVGVNSAEELRDLGTGAFLHDVGMREIPDENFMKDGFLSDEEWKLIRRHPQIGGHLLSRGRMKGEEILTIVRQHHEKTDGSGYPWGLKKHEMHPWSRMVAIADIFDAMTSKRPYRNLPASTFETLREMRIVMKEMVDQKFLDSFILLFAKKPLANTIAGV